MSRPPDGMIRYEGGSLTRGTNPATGATVWLPNREINESVEDWHHHNDIVYYIRTHARRWRPPSRSCVMRSTRRPVAI